MNPAAYLVCVILFLGTVAGLGVVVPLPRFLDPLERMTVVPAMGLVLIFLAAFFVYVLGLSWTWLDLAPILAAAGLWWRRREVTALLCDPGVRPAVLAWALVAAWTQGLLALVQNYSGAAWGGDWLEHHHRTRFFLQHWPLDYVFIGFYRLTARPPLANVVTAAFETLNRGSLPCDQVVLCLWSSLVFFPAALIYRRCGGPLRRLPVLAVLLMLNPSFVQNSTFAWTKLPAAFFVLAGAYFLFTALDERSSSGQFALAVGLLAAGILVHYSAAPYALVLAVLWIWRRAVVERGAGLAREAAIGMAVATPLLGVWFAWALVHYGWASTFLTNSTVLDTGPATFRGEIGKIAFNIWNTFVPHPLHPVDYGLIKQAELLAWFRDYFFLINQVTLPAMIGTGGLVALTAALLRDWPVWRRQPGVCGPLPVLITLAGCVFLGIAVVGSWDEWGVAHICLQAVDVFCLAALAARIDRIGRIGGAILVVGLLWDGAVNVGLHYYLQAQTARPEWYTPPNWIAVTEKYGPAAFNAWLKHLVGVRFLHDGFVPAGLTAVVLAGLLAGAIGRAILSLREGRAAPAAATPGPVNR